jgi:hypothetical protein
MTTRNWLLLNIVIFLAYAAGFIAIPDRLMQIYGADVTGGGLLVARFLASLLIGNAIVLWFARDELGTQTFRGIALGNVVTQVIGTVFAIYYTANGTLNGLGWGFVVIGVILALGWYWFGWARQTAVPARRP